VERQPQPYAEHGKQRHRRWRQQQQQGPHGRPGGPAGAPGGRQRLAKQGCCRCWRSTSAPGCCWPLRVRQRERGRGRICRAV
jgi:hypothetical protein